MATLRSRACSVAFFFAMLTLPATAATLPASTPRAPVTFNPGYSASWFAQIGLVQSIETQANGGAGFTIGFVDTGIVASQLDVVGRVSTLSSCAALTFKCSNGVTDDNGHGTAVAAIAAGQNVANGSSMMGLAPLATIVAEKVLNASGSGWDSDVANGINKAVAAGAQVINLSLTYGPSPSIVAAINAAASRGVVIVFAGGNDSASLNGAANTLGLTAQAVSHLVFAGSVNAANQLSSFSNNPGTGSVVAGTSRSSYASLWLMAPGERIVAPGTNFGPNALAYWTGTSMAAPIVSGALALLETTWPVLARNGTATSLLFATATDLGVAGVDTTYGSGLLNLSRAFRPVGTLAVIKANGQSVPVTQLTGTVISSGGLGSLSTVTAQLSRYTSFDSYSRNFYVDLSSLLTIKTATSAASLQIYGPVVTGGTIAVPGASVTFARVEGATLALDSAATSLDQHSAAVGPSAATGDFLLSIAGSNGAVFTTSRGFSAAPIYAEALWGHDSAMSGWSQGFEQKNDLLNLAAGGRTVAMGLTLAPETRIAFGWTGSETGDNVRDPALRLSNATAMSAGLTTVLARGWTGGVSLQLLDETNGLLGATYSDGALGFGRSHQTVAVALTSALNLGSDTRLILSGTLARTAGEQVHGGLVDGTSALLSRSLSLGLVERNLFSDADALNFQVAKPLLIMAGSLGLTMTDVDSSGMPVTKVQRVSLVPGGDETDLSLAYSRQIGEGSSAHIMLETQLDAGNVRGMTAGIVQFGLSFAL